MKTLVIYYSLDGSTKAIAETIAGEIGADVLGLKPIKQLRGGALSKHFWGGRQVVLKELPGLEPLTKNVADYDSLIIGTPVWAFNFAPPLRTFFSQKLVQNKKVALYCCCDGMAGKTLVNMRTELAGNEIIGELTLTKTAKNLAANQKIAIEWVKKFV
jgi:flavodoxin